MLFYYKVPCVLHAEHKINRSDPIFQRFHQANDIFDGSRASKIAHSFSDSHRTIIITLQHSPAFLYHTCSCSFCRWNPFPNILTVENFDI
jgi:hypothetical protein